MVTNTDWQAKDKHLMSFAEAVTADFYSQDIQAIGIGLLVDMHEDSTGEMGFTLPSSSDIPWGLETFESYEATKELWISMNREWKSLFFLENLKTMEFRCFFFYNTEDMSPWRKTRNDYAGAKKKFLELYKELEINE